MCLTCIDDRTVGKIFILGSNERSADATRWWGVGGDDFNMTYLTVSSSVGVVLSTITVAVRLEREKLNPDKKEKKEKS